MFLSVFSQEDLWTAPQADDYMEEETVPEVQKSYKAEKKRMEDRRTREKKRAIDKKVQEQRDKYIKEHNEEVEQLRDALPECPVCDLRFKTKRNLLRHMK